MKICCFFLSPLHHLVQVHYPFILLILAPNSGLFYSVFNAPKLCNHFGQFYTIQGLDFLIPFSKIQATVLCISSPLSSIWVYLKWGKFMDNHLSFYLCLSTDKIDKLLIWTSNFRISLPSLIIFTFTVSSYGVINLALLNFPNSGVLIWLSSSFYT